MGQSRMDNPEKLAALGTQDKGRRQTKQKTQHRKLKRWVTRPHQKAVVNSGAREGQVLPVSYKTHTMLPMLDIAIRKQTQIRK